MSKYTYISSPLNQFEIRNLLSLDAPILGDLQISLTNIGLYLTIGAFAVLTLNVLSTNYNKVISNSWSISQESLYATIHSIVTNQINPTRGQIYFPFIYTLFIFILINNLIGMIPYSFASTSHFILTFALSFTVVLGATILGFQKHGLEFFSLLVPAGCPLALLPLLVLIEFISYLSRNVSLGLRLGANILSGHMLLNILAGFTYNIMTSGFIFFFLGLIPLAFILAFFGLDLTLSLISSKVPLPPAGENTCEVLFLIFSKRSNAVSCVFSLALTFPLAILSISAASKVALALVIDFTSTTFFTGSFFLPFSTFAFTLDWLAAVSLLITFSWIVVNAGSVEINDASLSSLTTDFVFLKSATSTAGLSTIFWNHLIFYERFIIFRRNNYTSFFTR